MPIPHSLQRNGYFKIDKGSRADRLERRRLCYELSTLYRMYARSGQVDVNAANAMSGCDKGNATSAIATLKQLLTANQVKAPPQE